MTTHTEIESAPDARGPVEASVRLFDRMTLEDFVRLLDRLTREDYDRISGLGATRLNAELEDLGEPAEPCYRTADAIHIIGGLRDLVTRA